MEKVFIALAGVIVGFFLTFGKEIYYENKRLVVRSDTAKILFIMGIGDHHIKLHFKLIIHNRSTVRQPLWNLKLLIANGNEIKELIFQVPNPEFTNEVKADRYKGNNLFIRDEIDFDLVNIDAKSPDLIEFNWVKSTKTSYEYFSNATYYLAYEVLDKKVKLRITPELTSKNPTLKEIS